MKYGSATVIFLRKSQFLKHPNGHEEKKKALAGRLLYFFRVGYRK